MSHSIFPARGPVLVLLSFIVAACGGTSNCDRVDPYQSSREAGPIKVPSDLAHPEGSGALRVPDAGPGVTVRGPCADVPPPSNAAVGAKPATPAEKAAASAALPAGPLGAGERDNELDNEVKATLRGWLDAWREADADTHLAFYADDFEPPNSESSTDWFIKRRDLLEQSGTADIRIDRLVISAAENGAQARFVQESHNGGQINALIKEIDFVRVGERLLIKGERVVEVL